MGVKVWLFCVSWGVVFLFDFVCNSGVSGEPEGGHGGSPNSTISKDSLSFLERKTTILNGYGPEGRRIYIYIY